jgi:hypothetical protein
MAFYQSPRVINSNLVLAYDTANINSYAPYSSLTSMNAWSTGSGGTSGYGQNGDTAENQRVIGTNPFGRTSVLWETRASGNGEADGGWNSDYYSINNTKLYRFSIWVKRTSSTSGGTFYLGLYGSPSAVIRTDNDAAEGNPYWECAGTSKYTQDVWYLVVGHCYPHTQSGAIRHPNTGIYTVSGGTTKVDNVNGCNIGNDVKWASTTTSTLHRTYHYYCADSTTRLQFFGPRIDLIDGTEPTLNDLLTGRAYGFKDLSGNANDASLFRGQSFASTNRGIITFDGVMDYVNIANSNSLQVGATFTVSAWFNASNLNSSYGIFSTRIANSTGCWQLEVGTGNGGTGRVAVTGIATWIWESSNSVIAPNTWYNICFVRTNNSDAGSMYLNGQLLTPATTTAYTISNNSDAKIIGAGTLNSQYFPGNISNVFLYNRALSATEVIQNFNAIRSRYSI